MIGNSTTTATLRRFALLAVASLLALAACAAKPVANSPPAEASSVTAPSPMPDSTTPPVASVPTPSSVVQAPPSTAVVAVGPALDTARERAPVILQGTGQVVGRPSTPAPAAAGVSGDGFQLSFVDAEIATVVATVLGDGLGFAFSVDPVIKGTMSLQSSQALSREDVFTALESALGVLDIAIVNANGTYRVVPAKDAGRFVSNFRAPEARGQPGFGIQIVPLKFLGVADMERVLRPFAPAAGIVRVDEARNLMLLAGSTQEMSTMLEVVQIFDVDWLAGMSFALYNLNYVDAQTLTVELKTIFDDAKSPLAGVVRLIPLSRINAVLAITTQPRYLTDIGVWVKRLDLGGSTQGRRIYVYDVQHGKASSLAESLSKILAIESFGSSTSKDGDNTNRAAVNRPGTPSSPGAAEAPQFTESGGGEPTQLANGALRVVPNDENNSLLVLASPGEFGVIEAALQKLDIPARQVLIEAALAEVTLTNDLRYGVQWSYKGGDGPVILSEAGSGDVAQRFPGFSYLFTGRADIRSVLNAIESITTVQVVSAPKLMALNNQEAQLQIGDQVPITVGTAVSTQGGNAPIVNSVQFRDTGVILRVTPRVNRNGLVQLEISQEVSDVVPTTTSGIDSPTIQQRKISNTVAVRSGETVALGGLIRDRKSKSRSGVPFLAKIPGVGALFRSTADARGRTELIMLITPRVIQDPSENAQVLDDLEEEFRRLRKFAPDFKTLPTRSMSKSLLDKIKSLGDRRDRPAAMSPAPSPEVAAPVSSPPP